MFCSAPIIPLIWAMKILLNWFALRMWESKTRTRFSARMRFDCSTWAKERTDMPDEKVEAAIKNWAPRFISQGVDYNDFFRTTARIETWDAWCREWVAIGDVHYDLAVKAQNKGNTISAGEAYIAAALCYHFGKFLFQDHHNEYMSAANKAVDALSRGLKLLD